jgi:hypothetical protein
MAEEKKTRKTKKDYLLEVLEYGTEEQKKTLDEIVEAYKKSRAKKISEQKKIIRDAKKALRDLGYTKEDDEETTED